MSGESLTGFIPAGGQGSRLHPHTKEVPKPLLPMGYENLLIDASLRATTTYCDHVWVSTDFEAERVEAYVSQFPGVVTLRDERTTGNAGALLEKFEEVSQEDPEGDFLFIPADHVYEGFDLGALWKTHKEGEAEVTFMVVEPKNYGVFVDVDPSGRITSLLDRPTTDSLSTTGTYIFRNRYLFKVLRGILSNGWDGEPKNITFDLAHVAIEKARTATYKVPPNGYWDDAGTLMRYHQNNMRISSGNNVIDPHADVDDSIELRSCVVIGTAKLQGSGLIRDSIISGFSDGSTVITKIER